MSIPRVEKDEIDRLMQQAELYETQGLYDYALLVYNNILNKQPGNHKAKEKVSEIRGAQHIADTTGPPVSRQEDMSPRLALDLGLAYMGMSLYAEALEEFAKALKTSPAIRPDLLRYTISCLIHMEKYEKARMALDQLLLDPVLTLAEKGSIVADTVTVYLERDLAHLAASLLERLSEEQKEFVTDYDQLVEQVSGLVVEERFELEVEDTETGEVYREPLEEETTTMRRRAVVRAVTQPPSPTIPLKTTVSYSLDNKRWSEGISEEVSAQWAVLQIPEPVTVGDSLVVHIPLPSRGDEAVVSVISKVAELPSTKPDNGLPNVKVEFVSFLPGGETALKTFIDRAVRDPSILSEIAKSVESSGPRQAISDGQEETDGSVGDILDLSKEMAAPASGRPVGSPSSETVAIRGKADDSSKIRFSCICGQVHIVPTRNSGRQGKCGNCGEVLVVPSVDTRPDGLADQVIGTIVGGCRLLYKIGGGGMGGVFKGHHIALDIPVAVKILHSHLAEKDPVFIKRFIREARSAAKLQHPNIVGVMNVGFENGLHFLVMPYVGGGSAAGLLAKQGRMPLDKALDIGVDIARALTVAEESNLLHRDIKPANILFTDKGNATLADLGLAKNYLEGQDVGITQTGIACGTPLYFSPEQAKGSRNLDIRSDIYSFGITLYHLINGSPPFKGESAYVIFQKHVHEPLPPFDHDDPSIPDSVMELLKKMTAKNPDERFSHSQELLDVLESLRDQVKTAAGQPPITPLKKGLLERLGIKKSS